MSAPEPAGSAAARAAEFLGFPESRGLTAITGGGGKTALMESLAAYFARSASVVVTTTTKLFAGSGKGAGDVLFGADIAALRAALAEQKRVTLADRVEGGKLIGLAPEAIDAMFRAGAADHILVEADGAKRLPFKAYASHEPVVPRAATRQIVVVGAEIFIEPASEKNIFRFDLLRGRWGVERGRRMPFGTIIQMLESRGEYLRGAPAAAKRLLVVNKCDLFPDRARTQTIADGLAGALAAYDALMLISASRGECYAYRRMERAA